MPPHNDTPSPASENNLEAFRERCRAKGEKEAEQCAGLVIVGLILFVAACFCLDWRAGIFGVAVFCFVKAYVAYKFAVLYKSEAKK
jgi:4-hydroxybenzoate polyprenyltransferase